MGFPLPPTPPSAEAHVQQIPIGQPAAGPGRRSNDRMMRAASSRRCRWCGGCAAGHNSAARRASQRPLTLIADCSLRVLRQERFGNRIYCGHRHLASLRVCHARGAARQPCYGIEALRQGTRTNGGRAISAVATAMSEVPRLRHALYPLSGRARWAFPGGWGCACRD